jgi:hypothetical protein
MTFELEAEFGGTVVLKVRYRDGSAKDIAQVRRENVEAFLEALNATRMAYMEMGRSGV